MTHMRSAIGILFLGGAFSACTALAATVSVQPETVGARSGVPFLVAVVLDTQGESANAFEGTIVFPQSLAESAIRDENSIVNFWIEPPHFAGPGLVHFSGITPGGYSGDNGTLFSIVFVPRYDGMAIIEPRDIAILRNDGRGTSIPTIGRAAHSTISPSGTARTPPPFDTRTPPDDFSVTITSSPAVFDGRFFASFHTEDRGSGIDHYEVAERDLLHLFTPEALLFATRSSPYPLRDQTRTGILKVRAVDRAGNVRTVAIAEPRHTIALVVLGLGVFGFVVLLIWYFLKRFDEFSS